MTYPVDDAGNPQVDFVWGHMPLQPNDQRGAYDNEGNLSTNKPQNKYWTVSKPVGSANLSTGWTEIPFNTGDGGNTRYQTITWDSHEIATGTWENYPGFATGGVNDDLIPNATVPNVVGLGLSFASSALNAVGLGLGNVTNHVESDNPALDGVVYSQSVPAGTIVNQGDTVDLVQNQYVVPVNHIAGFSTTNLPSGWTLGDNEIVMYITGRTIVPSGSAITVTGNTNATLNQNFNVIQVANDDHYNTGGTAVKLHGADVPFINPNTNTVTDAVWVNL